MTARYFLVRIMVCCGLLIAANTASAQWDANYSVASATGAYTFTYNQTPANLVQVSTPVLAGVTNTLTYQWESSPAPDGVFVALPLPAGGQTTYVFSGPLAQTTYFRCKVSMNGGANIMYSNVIKIEVVSINWENINYRRVHEVLVPGMTDWKVIDQMSIGQKLQSTEFFDGMDRSIQVVNRQEATPATQGGNWGDVISFSTYDTYGRADKQYLPYTKVDAAAPGKFKSAPVSDQLQYYSTVYNETAPYTSEQFDFSPLSRTVTQKSSGTSWNASTGVTAAYLLNDASEIRLFTIGNNTGDVPVSTGYYLANTLTKTVTTDEKGRQSAEYRDADGKVILKKVAEYGGFICTYAVFDDYGKLRYLIQPEAVKWLEANNWSFSGTDGQQVLNEMCFRYEYDERGNMTVKKAPGAKEIYMVYDGRDRLVFSQDGNQRAKPGGEWLATTYDDLDRPVVTALYETSKTAAQLITDIINATPATGNIYYKAPDLTNYRAEMDVNIRTLPFAAPNTYAAAVRVSFLPGFSSLPNDNFTTTLAPTVQQLIGVNRSFGNPIPAAVLSDITKYIPTKYMYYDDYTYPGVKSFDNGYNNTLAYQTSDPTVMPIAKDNRTINKVTGTKVRILGTSNFLVTSYYYDAKGKRIQELGDNVKTGVDIITSQYHFDGRLLSSDERHTAPGTLYTNFDILYKKIYDLTGRLSGLQAKIGSNAFKTLSTYDLDDMGRLKTQHLDPGFAGATGSELESLTYSYNLHSHITGINKDYALKTPGNYNKWGHFVGMYMSYDNKEGLFTYPQFDGSICGTIWSTMGDDVQRKYDYSYDLSGRLRNASFSEKQNPGDNWSSAKMDFSVTGTGGSIQYDFNGNLLSMIQKGVLPGSASPVNVDDLQYTYVRLSNRLASITDNGSAGASNGKLGDFKDGANGAANDYVFDDNGNIVIDLNKAISAASGQTNGILYNYLDKPETIRVNGKGTIQIAYDADGNKVQKTYTPDGGGAAITTTYVGPYVYVGNNLQYIDFTDGRIRVMQAVADNNGYDFLSMNGTIDLPGSMRGAFDYFIKDHLGNIRMIVTDESHTGGNTCTMETARAANEERLFGKIDANGNPASGNEVAARFPVNSIPGNSTGGGWQNANIGSYVSQLGNLVGRKVGPNALLKVMAGDQIATQTMYYYQNPVTNGVGTTSLITDVLSSLATAIDGSPITSGVLHGNSAGIISPMSSSVPFSSIVEPDANNSAGTAPKAYLSILFFDERFNFVQDGSFSTRVTTSGSGAPVLIPPVAKAPKNGYVYVFVSNESNETVYFDNLKVTNVHSPILEEDHYYAFGLKIAPISSRLLADTREGFTVNKELYNGKEIIDEADLNWYDYGFRNYDPQIGRFVQLDPLSSSYPHLTPYQYASNDPILNVDLDGLEGIPYFGFADIFKDFSKYWFAIPVVRPTAQQLGLMLTRALSKLSEVARGTVIVAGGSMDAYLNNLRMGIFPVDHTEEYTNPMDKMWYLGGKVIGDLASITQGGAEVTGGGAAATQGLLTAGVTGGVTLIESAGGALVAGHGALVIRAATSDLKSSVKQLMELYTLYATSHDAGSGNNNKEDGGSRSPDQNSDPGSNSNSRPSEVKAKDLKLTHQEQTITRSSDYQKIKKLSDKELVQSVTNPKQYDPVTINTKTGKIVDGNTRIYEIQRRGLDVNVPVKYYTPDDSFFNDPLH